MEDKKKSKNFTSFEKNYLVELIQAQISVIENKKSDSCSLDTKARAWDQVTVNYNASQQTGQRSAKQLKELYQVLKRNARKNLAADRAERYKTGGGIYVSTSTDLDKKIIAATKDQFMPDRNPFDSSTVLLDTVSPNIIFPSKDVFTDQENCYDDMVVITTPNSNDNCSLNVPLPPIAVNSQLVNEPTVCTTTSTKIQNKSTIPSILEIASSSHLHSTFINSPEKYNSPKNTIKKRKHPVDNLTTIIQDRKKFKNQLDQIDIENKKLHIQEEIQERRELHKVNMDYQKLLIEEQTLKVEGVRLDNEIKKIELLMKKKQLEQL